MLQNKLSYFTFNEEAVAQPEFFSLVGFMYLVLAERNDIYVDNSN